MSNAIDYETVDAGTTLYATITLEDDNESPVTPGSIVFYLTVGDSETSTAYPNVELVEAGSYRVALDTTEWGGNWLWGEWVTTGPSVSQNWQAYVQERYSGRP